MTDKEIKDFFWLNAEQRGFFKKMSVLELCEMMTFCETNFRTSKGNWSIKKVQEFCYSENQKYSLGLSINLHYFYAQYYNRKKKNQGFNNFISNLFDSSMSQSDRVPELKEFRMKKLKIVNKIKTKKFLKSMKDVKNKYLLGTDEMIIKLISQNIKTGYSETTLRKYYYEK